MKNGNTSAIIAAVITLLANTTMAQDFATEGSTATLTVEYSYESAGNYSSEGMYDPYEWNVKRNVNLVATLAAQQPTALPSLQGMDAEQLAEIENKTKKAEALATDMQPMMANAESIMAKCGEDEACLMREAMAMGAAMQGTAEMETAMQAGAEFQKITEPGTPRYQRWQANLQKGTYVIDEKVHISVTDPICMELPTSRCTRNEVRQGSGDLPLPPDMGDNPDAIAGYSAVELDADKNTLSVMLPIPLALLPYTETITTDEPEGTHETPTPIGPQPQLLSFQVSPGSSTQDAAITLDIKDDWRNQSGQHVIAMGGQLGESGNLTISWKFEVTGGQ